MLASWIQQCSFSPPQITLTIQKERYLVDWLAVDATFAVNVLDDSQTDMIIHFGRGFAPDARAFENLAIQRSANQNVVLREALAYLECKVKQTVEAGDHHLILAEVIDGELLGEGHPMIHVRKNGLHY